MKPMTWLLGVSVGLQLVLWWAFDWFAPTAYPKKVQKIIISVFGGIAIVGTGIGYALYPAALPVSPFAVLVVLLILAVIPPFAGLVESRCRTDGQAVFAGDRFRGHLLTNVLGAVAAAALVLVGHSTKGFATLSYANDAAFNIMLPLSTFVILAFVRWQQTTECTRRQKTAECPGVDERCKRNDTDWESCITGFSLKHVHQLTNTIYLIVVSFTATTSILYLFAYAMDRAKHHHPVDFSWQMGVAIGLTLLFLFACGGPWSRNNRAVFLTFLTGTPAAIGAAIVWLSLLKESTSRTVAMVLIVGLGYILYCIGAVLGSRGDKEKLALHYFSATAIFIALALLAGAAYVSN